VQIAQTLINSYCEDFLEWAKEDMSNLEKAYQELQNDDGLLEQKIKNLLECALLIKSRAGTFGFTLASSVAHSLVKTCEEKSSKNKELFVSVLRQHINALQVIFQQKMTGDGETMGTELLDGLFFIANKLENI